MQMGVHTPGRRGIVVVMGYVCDSHLGQVEGDVSLSSLTETIDDVIITTVMLRGPHVIVNAAQVITIEI